MSDIAAFLQTVPGFALLTDGDRERAADAATSRAVEAGEHLMRRGEPGDSMYVVRIGRLKVPVFDEQGDLRLVAHLGPGCVVGEMALLTGGPRTADVIADEDTELVAFDRDTFVPMLAEHPPLARFLTEILGHRLEEAGGIREVGKYRLLDKIGQGATAKVYEALHPGLGRTVAVKMLSHELVYDGLFKQRFLDEARTVASLGHPNIVQVFDTEEAYGTCFVVMERLQGSNLQTHLAEHGPLSVDDACTILEQVGEALAFAHRHGIVHRDVKPANIAIDDDGTVKLMDFGIAAPTRTLRGRRSTVEGTPHYIAPEAATGAPIDGRSDLYSLGVVAFEMFAGRPLFVAETVKELLEKHVRQPIPDLSRLRPDLPAGATAFVRAALTKDPTQRPARWEDLRRLLGRDLDAGTEERVVRIRYQPNDRHRVARAVDRLRDTLSGVPECDVAEAMLTAAAPEPDPSPTKSTGLTSWFSRFSRGNEEPGETRSVPTVEDDAEL